MEKETAVYQTSNSETIVFHSIFEKKTLMLLFHSPHLFNEVVVVHLPLRIKELVLDVLQQVGGLVRAPLCVLQLSLVLLCFVSFRSVP